MNLNQKTLIQFEAERLANNLVPPEKSNSFYNIGNGSLNLYCLRVDRDGEDYRFDIYTESGSMCTGDGNFQISGDIVDLTKPYNSFTVKKNSELCVTDRLTINKGTMQVHGTLHMMKGSQIIVNNGGSLILYSDSIFQVSENTSIIVEKGSSISIYGDINVKLSVVDSILNNPGIYIDSAAHVNVEDINLGEREFSLTDYEISLRDKDINPHTQGEYNSSTGRLGYTWKGGSSIGGAQVIELGVLWGEAVLGDFKLSVLGKQKTEVPNLQVVESFQVAEGTTLYISESYHDFTYIRPELYLGIIIGNSDTPASALVDGNIVVDGKNSRITVDRGSTITIGPKGSIYLKNGSVIRSTHNDPKDILLTIDGTLIIEDISQISTFEADNIVFGKKGKVVILNPDTGERRLLWSTPNRIEDTDLYRIFKKNIKHIEYHISNNTGIAIDQYFEFYGRDMTNWYGGIRIEKAIHEGMIVWHDGGFIELNHAIIPWANTTCSLLHASRIFKSFGSYDNDRLQDVINRLNYAGAGNIVFRFIEGDQFTDVTMTLEGIKMKSVVNKPLTDAYIIESDNSGKLFARDMASGPDTDYIINKEAKVINLNKGETEFQL